MKIHTLTPKHHAHLRKIGVPWLRPPYIRAHENDYREHYEAWKRTKPTADHDELDILALGSIGWQQHCAEQAKTPEQKRQKRDDRMLFVALLIIVLLLVKPMAHCQFSHINYIDIQNQGSDIGFFTAPFTVNFTGAGVSCANSAGVVTCTVTGGSITNNPGGSNTNVQYNNAGAFGGIAEAHLGAVLIDQGPGQVPAFADPLVQGTQAAASTTIPNPVVIGGSDYGGTPAVRVGKVDSNGIFQTHETGTPTVTANAGTNLNTSALALETGGNLAAIKTDVDKIPASPSTDRTTAAAPFSTELSDGAAFYTAAKTGQFPAALDGSGFLKVHEQGTAAVSCSNCSGTVTVSGTVTANQGGAPWSVNQTQVAGSNLVADPCQVNTINFVSINQTANTKLVTGTAAKKIYICAIHVVTAGANNVALVEGTGTTCATGTAGVSGFGGATAATGWNFAANDGLTYGNGAAALGAEGTNADDLCLYQSAAVQLSGGIRYVVQ